MKTLIKHARVVNEGTCIEADVLIEGGLISKIASGISAQPNYSIVDAEGSFLIPGAIDDQVHFREPGLTHKGTIASESAAAIAGGITSYIEQPNTIPHAVTHEVLEQKYAIASDSSFANYSFMLGGTNNNLEEVKKTNPKTIAGIKIFMGSSTGNMLVDEDEALEQIFTHAPTIIATHCEDEKTVQHNLAAFKEKYGEQIKPEYHPLIRSEEACYLSSSKAVALAQKTGARLHVFHLSTAREMALFSNKLPLVQKKITAEVCIHHLMFSDKDYLTKGNLIKWNPAIKSEADRNALWQALLDDTIDVIATDHAPHTWEEKNKLYIDAPSGGPLVQHAVVAMFDKYLQGTISVEKIVEKMAHNPAILFEIDRRGFIREGYFADLTIIDPALPWRVQKGNILAKCAWSPFEGDTFKSRVTHTFVNGELVFHNGKINQRKSAMRLSFNR